MNHKAKKTRSKFINKIRRYFYPVEYVIIIAMVFLVSCKSKGVKQEGEMPSDRGNKFEGYEVEDDKSLDELLTTTYELKQLRAFFDGRNSEEVFNDYMPNLTYTEVNEHFPVEVIRSTSYTVYKVSEGGYFYVFWERGIDMETFRYVDELDVNFSCYINESKGESAFDSIKPDISTMADVRRVDPDANFTFVTTPAISSSYLNEDSVLQIKYYYKYDREYEGNEASYEAGIRDESNYYVESVEVVSRENAMSRYRSIFSKDLP